MSNETTSGLKMVKVESARVRVNNENDAHRTVEIEAVMEVRSDSVSFISAGVVSNEGVQVASFSSGGSADLHIDFMRSTGNAEVLATIDAFCEDIRANGPALVNF